MAPVRPASRQATPSFLRKHANRVAKPTPPIIPSKAKKLKSASNATDSDRVTTDVLLAIKPTHLANIARRQKNHEYRKYRLRDGISRLWLYETSEGGQGRSAITHIAVIPETIRRTPGEVPTEPFGIGNENFNNGLKKSKYGYPIMELYELVKPVTLKEMKDRWGIGGAPMGWRYVGAELWADRWGKDEEEREGKVRKVFSQTLLSTRKGCGKDKKEREAKVRKVF